MASLLLAFEGAGSEEGCSGRLLPGLAMQACTSELCSNLVVTWAGYLLKQSVFKWIT